MSEVRCKSRCYPKLVITSPLIHYVVHRLSNSSNDIKSRWINRKPTWTSFYRPLLNHNITKQLHDDFFSKKEVAIPRTMIVWSCLSQSSHYTVWVLPVNEESQNQRINMLMRYMVPWNAAKELYNVMISVVNLGKTRFRRKKNNTSMSACFYVFSFVVGLLQEKEWGQPTTPPQSSNDFPHGLPRLSC